MSWTAVGDMVFLLGAMSGVTVLLYGACLCAAVRRLEATNADRHKGELVAIGGAAAAFAAALVLAPTVALACSCTPSFEDQVSRAAYIFVGHIASTAEVVDATRDSDPHDPTRYFIEARYRVREVLKGLPPDEGVLRDWRPQPGSCSARLMAGTEFIVFASAQLGTSVCTGATVLDAVNGKNTLQRVREAVGRLRSRAESTLTAR